MDKHLSVVAQYFLNHRLDLEEVERQVELLADAGYQGVEAHARQGLLTPYMSDAWWQAVDRILDVCRRRGLQFWIWDEDYFPSGLAGGRVVWEEPGLIARGLTFTVADVSGAGPFEVDLADGMLLRAFALRSRGSGRYDAPEDITRHCGTRRREWTARVLCHSAYSPGIDPVGHPHWRADFHGNHFAIAWRPKEAGDYRIIGTVVAPTGSLTPDQLSAEAVRRFIDLSHEQYRARYPQELGTLIGAAFTDEPGPGLAYPWSARLLEAFGAEHGYDLIPCLPHLAVDLDDRSPQVRHHYRQTQHRLQRASYFEQIGAWCEAHGILFTGHLPRTEHLSAAAVYLPNELRMYQPLHLPAADPLGAASGWPDAASYHTGVKVVSSASHLFGRPRASSDALAVVGDRTALRDLKHLADYQMVLGISHFNVHGLCYSTDGPRKDEAPPSLFYQHSEWEHMGVLVDYLRCACEELAQGVHDCRLALLYPSTSLACQATPTGDFTRLADEPAIHGLVEWLLSHHCDFDWIDELTLAEKVDGAGRMLTPESYAVILLPHLRFIDESAAAALRRYARGGGRVVAIPALPRAVTRDVDRPLRDWADGAVTVAQTAEALVAELDALPLEGPGAQDVFALRRERAGGALTFLYNRSREPFAGRLEEREVSLPGHGSLMVVGEGDGFRVPPDVRRHVHQVPPAAPGAAVDLSTGWTAVFPDNHVPLNLWHVVEGEAGRRTSSPFAAPACDLMARQQDPSNRAAGTVIYYNRFMLEGPRPDARLVMDESAVGGQWRLLVNGLPIAGWRRATVFDCCQREVPVGPALRTGTSPTLNVVAVEATGEDRGLREMPYLCGPFQCEYRYGHLSLPFLRSVSIPLALPNLLPWRNLGYPTLSGTATYSRGVAVPEPGDYALDLGTVDDIAEVCVDGRDGIVLAWAPYQCALDGLSAGEHELTIRVTNGPANRDHGAGFAAGLLGPVRWWRLAGGRHDAAAPPEQVP